MEVAYAILVILWHFGVPVLLFLLTWGVLILCRDAIRDHAFAWVSARSQWKGWRSGAKWLFWRAVALLLALVFVVVLFAPLYVPFLLSGLAFPEARPLLTCVFVLFAPAILLSLGGKHESGD